jgi:pimeloyl-ACP methyl ester carboxylesterase
VGSFVNPDIIQHYHAHVYYDPASSRDRAARLRERVAATFPGVTLGRWHDTPVGPHTQFQSYFRNYKPPFLAVWGKNDPFFLPAGAEAFKRDIPNAEVRFFDTGHFALETHCDEIAAAIRNFLSRPPQIEDQSVQ